MTAPTPNVDNGRSCAADRTCPAASGCCDPASVASNAPSADSTAATVRSKVVARAGFGAAACVACCAPPIVATLGLTAGLAATVGLFLGLAAAIVVALLGGAWFAARVARGTRSGGASTQDVGLLPDPSAADPVSRPSTP